MNRHSVLLFLFLPAISCCYYDLTGAKAKPDLAASISGDAIVSVPSVGSRSAAVTDDDTAKNVNYIVGGIETAPTAWPFAVSILFRNSTGLYIHYCGGTLIRDRWVLTAAHCEPQRGDYVIMGRHNLRSPGGIVARIEAVLPHPHYGSGTHDNDIALIRLGAPGAPGIPKARLDVPPTIGQQVTAIGWGAIRFRGPQSAVLRQVTVPVRDHGDCVTSYANLTPPIAVTQNMICAAKDGQDSCQGDSGGPLLSGDTGSPSQVGVVSFGRGCGLMSFPGVYTRVDHYMQWIAENVS